MNWFRKGENNKPLDDYYLDFNKWFNNLIKNKKPLEDYNECLKFILDNRGFEASYYKKKHKFKKLDISKNLNNEYYVITDKLTIFDNDIITNFRVKGTNDDIKISFIFDKKELEIEKDDFFIPFCASYSPLNIKITFKEISDDIELIYDAFLLQNNIRKEIVKQPVKTDNILYAGGQVKI